MSPARPKSQRLEVRGPRAPSRGDGLSPSPGAHPLRAFRFAECLRPGSFWVLKAAPGKPHLPHPKARYSGPRWAPPLCALPCGEEGGVQPPGSP